CSARTTSGMKRRKYTTGRIQNVPTSTNEPSNKLGCPYASATETATTVPGSAHGTSINNESKRRPPRPSNVARPRSLLTSSITTQKLHTNAANAAIADIEKLLKNTPAALGSPKSR